MWKLAVILCCFSASISNTNAFWSLDSDLQFGFQVYDLANEISANIQAVATVATRSYIIQTDDDVRICVRGLTTIATHLRNAPTLFFNELNFAASSRTNTELFHIKRLRSHFTSTSNALNLLLDSTGPLADISYVGNPYIISRTRINLEEVLNESNNLMEYLETITRDVSIIRKNVTTALTPQFIHSSLNPQVLLATIESLSNIRDAFINLKSGVLDTARIAVAQGSIYEEFQRTLTRNTNASTTSLNTFNNNYIRVRNNLIASVNKNRESVESGFLNFIRKVQSSYGGTIVGDKFDKEQLPLIQEFNDVIVSRVYNQSLFELSFDNMHDSIVKTFTEKPAIFSVYQTSFIKSALIYNRYEFTIPPYDSCFNDFVSNAQDLENTISKKEVSCLNERNSAILVTIPSTTTWMKVILENTNNIIKQLNSCIKGKNTNSANIAASECIDASIGNLPFYASYLPSTVEANLKPIVESSPMIFDKCFNNIGEFIHEYTLSEAFYNLNNNCMLYQMRTTTSSPLSTIYTTQ